MFLVCLQCKKREFVCKSLLENLNSEQGFILEIYAKSQGKLNSYLQHD